MTRKAKCNKGMVFLLSVVMVLSLGATAFADQQAAPLAGEAVTVVTPEEFKAAMEAGGAVINGASFFRSFEMPFGGWKHSGIGTEGVLSTFNEMTRVKTIVLKNVL